MKYKDSNGNIKELVLRGNFNNVLTKDNSISYTPSDDYNPATKKYVDDATFIYVFNAQDDMQEIKQKNLDTINKYFADTNMNKRLVVDMDGLKMDFDMIFTEGLFWGLAYSYLSPVGSENGGSIFFGMIESENGTSYTHSKKVSQLVGALDVLMKTNTETFTPTLDYHPATKKYVDDNTNSAPNNSYLDSSYREFIYRIIGMYVYTEDRTGSQKNISSKRIIDLKALKGNSSFQNNLNTTLYHIGCMSKKISDPSLAEELLNSYLNTNKIEMYDSLSGLVNIITPFITETTTNAKIDIKAMLCVNFNLVSASDEGSFILEITKKYNGIFIKAYSHKVNENDNRNIECTITLNDSNKAVTLTKLNSFIEYKNLTHVLYENFFNFNILETNLIPKNIPSIATTSNEIFINNTADPGEYTIQTLSGGDLVVEDINRYTKKISPSITDPTYSEQYRINITKKGIFKIREFPGEDGWTFGVKIFKNNSIILDDYLSFDDCCVIDYLDIIRELELDVGDYIEFSEYYQGCSNLLIYSYPPYESATNKLSWNKNGTEILNIATEKYVDDNTKVYTLTKNNTTEYIPTADYHPATKKYVDDSITTMYRFKYRISETAEQKQENIDIIKSYLNNVSNNKKFIFDVISSNGSVNYSIEAGIVTSNVASKTLNASGTLMFYDQMGYVGVLSTNLTYSNETYTVGGFESMLVTGNQLEKLLEDKLYPMDITNNTLTLNRNKYQSASITNDTTIILPTTTAFTEIHLYFATTADLNITMPTEVKWQTQPSFLANKTYELIFTYVNSSIGWLGGVVQYE